MEVERYAAVIPRPRYYCCFTSHNRSEIYVAVISARIVRVQMDGTNR